MTGKRRFNRILAGVLCLLLLVGFLPADILGGLIQKADAAVQYDYAEQNWATQSSLNGMFILRSSEDPSLVLTSTDYFSEAKTLVWKKLGAESDIRRQIFVFRQAVGSNSDSFTNHEVYFRPLNEVYRWKESNGTQHGHLWVTSNTGHPYIYPLTTGAASYQGFPDDQRVKFAWRVNRYGTREYNGTPCLIAGIYDPQLRNNFANYYLKTSNVQNDPCVLINPSDIVHTQILFEPVSYNVTDDKNVSIYTQASESSLYYMGAPANATANSTVMSPNGNSATWYSTWTLVRAGGGYYHIVSAQYERYLAHNGTSVVLGNVAATTDEGTWTKAQDAETWQIVPYTHYLDGHQATTYLIINKATGKLLLRSADNSKVIADNYDKNYSANCHWLIRYSSNSFLDNGFAWRNQFLQTDFSGSSSISYPMALKQGEIPNSTYHTLRLNQATATHGYFLESEIASTNTAALESNLKPRTGWLFDSGLTTTGTITQVNEKPGVLYSSGTGIIENSSCLYRLNNANNSPKIPFKPNNSSSYSATIRFQFKYQNGMFFNYSGYGAGALSVRILRKDGTQIYPTGTTTGTGENSINLSSWCSTPGEIYTIEFTKTSTNDQSSHFKIFTNVQPLDIYKPVDSQGNSLLISVGANVYQDGNKLALNGAAVIGKPLEYGFTVTNKNQNYSLFVEEFSSHNLNDSAEQISHWGIRNLGGFSVNRNGNVTQGNARDKNGNQLDLADLIFNVYNANGAIVYTLTSPTAAKLTQILTHVPHNADASITSYGLPYGWTVEVRGIYYTPTTADKETYARKMVVPYVTVSFHTPGLNSTISKYGDNTSVHFTNEPFFVQWVDQSITIKKELLFELIEAAGKHKYEIEDQGLRANNITSLVIVDNSGAPYPTSNIVVRNNTDLVLQHSQVGGYQYNIKVNFNNTFAFVPIQVFVYDISDDNVFVLDYGLPVEIPVDRYTTGNDFTQPRDKLEIGTKFETTISIHMVTGTKPTHDGTYLDVEESNTTYGTVSLGTNNTITYTPTDILNGPDYIYVVFKLVRNTQLGVSVADELLMYKTITILPANVIYYEDNNGGIKYPEINKIEITGQVNGVSGTQTLPSSPGGYGYDDGSYAGSEDVTISGLGYHKIPIHDKQVEVTFTFTGTGFELISRVNASDSATILIYVTDSNNMTKVYPVITRFDPFGTKKTEVYQVPVFRLNETTSGTYSVKVVGLPMTEYDENGVSSGNYTTNYLYVDGIRIYNPLGNNALTENYGSEKDAEFDNLRDLILAGHGMITATDDNKTNSFLIGEYYYTQTESKYFTAVMGDVNMLGAIGANNEVLIRKTGTMDNMLVLRVKGNGLLQIGIRDMHEAMFDGDTKTANSPTTVSLRTTSGWSVLANQIYHGTEQYYNIDLSSCPTDGEFKIVLLKVDSGFASFTNIKHKNVEFGKVGEAAYALHIQNNFYFNEDGDIVSLDQNGNEVVYDGDELFDPKLIDSLLRNDTV